MAKFDALNNKSLAVEKIFEKYKLGEQTDKFNEISQLQPIFSFDYISLNKSNFCFDGTTLGKPEYKNLLTGLKDVSQYSYHVLNRNDRFHFHEVKWKDVNYSSSHFHKSVYGEFFNDESDLTPYQFKVFGKARVVGFLYKGVFYLVLFEVGHKGYLREDKGKGKRKKKKK